MTSSNNNQGAFHPVIGITQEVKALLAISRRYQVNLAKPDIAGFLLYSELNNHIKLLEQGYHDAYEED
jgi:hypothetical protein